MDSERRQALSNFYREEFLRHIEHLQASGILNDGNRAAVDRAWAAETGPGVDAASTT